MPADDMDEDDFDLEDVSSLGGDMVSVLKQVNLLSDNDSAVLPAKLSSELIAGVLQVETVELVETTDIEEAKKYN